MDRHAISAEYPRNGHEQLLRFRLGLEHLGLAVRKLGARFHQGAEMSRLTNDSEVISLFYESAVTDILRVVIQIVLTFLVMLFIDWRLTIVAILVVPVMLVAMNIADRISSPAFEKLQEDLSDLSGFQEETLSGNKVIISNRRQEWADERDVELAALLFLVGALLIGLLLGGREARMRSVMGLGTAQRNLAAAMLVAAQNFPDDPNVLVMVMLIGILGLILLMSLAGEMGRRVQSKSETGQAEAVGAGS